MKLMREATKRLLRLTPFVSFAALEADELRNVVSDAFDAAAAGIAGEAFTMPVRSGAAVPAPSSVVTQIQRMSMAAPVVGDEAPVTTGRVNNFDEVAQAALDIVRRTGRVTNLTLREIVPITSDEAREVFRVLLERGEVVRRGVKRGTHYVLPEADDPSPEPVVVERERRSGPPTPPASPSPGAAPQPAAPPAVVRRVQRPSETALRRLLRRGR
jgi:hypothetical protein